MNFEGPAAIDRAGIDPELCGKFARHRCGRGCIAHRHLVDRNALARYGGLVDAACPEGHKAIGRDARIRSDDDDIADDQFGHGHFAETAVPPDLGGRGREVGKCGNGTPRTTHRIVLQSVSDAKEEEQKGSLGPFAEHRRARRRNQHQEIDLETTEKQCFDGFAQQVIAAKAVGGHIEEKGNPCGDRQKER
nr:hypothetical protein RNT25_04624 [arsenite-oxidising bacterium NT-25]